PAREAGRPRGPGPRFHRKALSKKRIRDMNGIRPVRLSLLDLAGLGLVGIRTRPLRAVLSALGISISIATIVIVTGVPASSRQALSDELSKLGPDVLQAGPV